jgi:hypothetical protein
VPRAATRAAAAKASRRGTARLSRGPRLCLRCASGRSLELAGACGACSHPPAAAAPECSRPFLPSRRPRRRHPSDTSQRRTWSLSCSGEARRALLRRSHTPVPRQAWLRQGVPGAADAAELAAEAVACLTPAPERSSTLLPAPDAGLSTCHVRIDRGSCTRRPQARAPGLLATFSCASHALSARHSSSLTAFSNAARRQALTLSADAGQRCRSRKRSSCCALSSPRCLCQQTESALRTAERRPTGLCWARRAH